VDELAGHVSQAIVELNHNVVDVVDAFPILAAVVRKEVRCTANRREAHQHDLANIDIVQILYKKNSAGGQNIHMYTTTLDRET
jgi:hypothetical protein